MVIDKDEVKKILCIKPRGIGDVILSSIVFNNLLENFPGSKIDYLTEFPSKPLLEPLPFINEVLLFGNNSVLDSISTIKLVRKRKYDLVFDFYSNPRTALVTFFSGARYRVGFPYRGRAYAYNLFGPSERNKFHSAALHLEMLNKIGLTCNHSEMFFGLTKDDIEFSRNFFEEKFQPNDLVIGISPSGGWQSKKSDPIKFAEIGDALVNKYSAKILLLWGPGDKNEAIEIERLMTNEIIVAPLTDIRKMGALISNCKILIANDSGPMHIGVALKTPVLSVHGPTNPKLQGPYGEMHEWVRLDELDCIGCDLRVCPRKHECFLELPIERIMIKIDSLIKKNEIKLVINEKN